MHAGDAGPAGVDESFDAMVLHGLHAMAEAQNGVLSHSFYPMPKNIYFNEKKIGEIAMNIYGFSEYDVPCVMITGDQAAVDEAKSLIPNIVGVPVKWGLGEKRRLGALSIRRAISLSPEKARERIREAARTAIARVDEFKPLKFTKPFSLKVEYIKQEFAEEKMKMPGVTRIDEVTIGKMCKSLEEVIF